MHEMEPRTAQHRGINLQLEIWDALDRILKKIADGPPDPYKLAYVNFAIKFLEQLFSQIGQERHLHRRNLGEARESLKLLVSFQSK